MKERLIIRFPRVYIGNKTKKIKVEIYGNHHLIQTISTKFIGPIL